MQDGNSNIGMDAAKRGTIGQAHLMRGNERHVFYSDTVMQGYKSKNESKNGRRITTEYDYYLHKHTYTVLT